MLLCDDQADLIAKLRSEFQMNKLQVKILKCHLKNLRLSGGVDENDIAKKTPGYVGADLAALVNEAATLAVSRVFENAKKNDRDAILTEQRLKDSEPLTRNELSNLSL